jgi:hypothetical protein
METYISDIKQMLKQSTVAVEILGNLVDVTANANEIDIGNNIFLEIADELKEAPDALDYYTKTKEFIDDINDISTENDAFLRYWKLTKLVMDNILGYTPIISPAAKIISKYMEMPIAAKETIDMIVNRIYNQTMGVQLSNAVICIRVQKQGSWWQTQPNKPYFSQQELASKITKIEVIGYTINNIPYGPYYLPKALTAGALNDSRTIYGLTDGVDLIGTSVCYCKITWANDRITIVPLTTDFISTSGGTLTDQIIITFKTETNDPDKIPNIIQLRLP